MKFYENHLHTMGYEVVYIEASNELSDVRNLIPALANQGVREICFCDVTDDWLERRIKNSCESNNLKIIESESPLFINTREEINAYFNSVKRLHQTDFYIHQRKKRNILLVGNTLPAGGKWSYDQENRSKYPANKTPERPVSLPLNSFDTEAIAYTDTLFSQNYGQPGFKYPTTYNEAAIWLNDFLERRFQEFGVNEDAIVAGEHILNHSVLSPLINVGLVLPMEVLDKAIDVAARLQIPLNSTEGFIRQILGWREFIRMVYERKGREERTKNFWNFRRKIPASFWNGTTGIEPVDITIRKVLKTGYCHHIERLMVLGNFMLLCEFDPDDVYRWFMELFIDAYDWVMVPNVYGMSQFADGGLMSTKPYISGSNYLMKMGNYRKGAWQNVWDGLFWNFIHTRRDFFLQNPRLGMMVNVFDKMDDAKQKTHLDHARRFLASMD